MLIAERQAGAPRPVDTALGFRALIDSLPVGMVWLDGAGRAMDWNEPAEVFLSSTSGAAVEALIARLHQQAAASQGCVQASCELSGAERLSVSVAPDRAPHTFLVVLDRQKLEKARGEASVLREVLKALASSESRRDAVQRAVSTVHTAVPVLQLAVFELDGMGAAFACTASAGVAPDEPALATPVTNSGATLLSVATSHSKTVHVPAAIEERDRLPFSVVPGAAVMLLPIGRKGSSAVLYVSAQADGLSEGVLRVVQALADAIGALQDLVTLEAEAARAREVAAQRDRLATIGQLVAGVAHEINNPLAFLKSNLSTLKTDADELLAANQTGEILEMVTESLEGVARIETIVQALKGTARKTQEKIRFDAVRSVSEAVTIFRGAKKAECEVDLDAPAELPEVVGSPSAIGQIVLNLLQNGLDAMGALERKARRLEVRVWAEPESVRFSVRDGGTGIPPEVQRRMFDAFYTTKDPGKGTGLGLFICRDLLEGMGGAIRFTTGPGGTTFTCELPAVAEVGAPPGEGPPKTAAAVG